MSFKEVFQVLSKRRYIIVTLLFAAVIVFFDQYNIFEQGRSFRKCRKVDREIEEVNTTIKEQKQTLNALRNDSAYLEKVAREQHFMKRDDEVIYYLDIHE
ncbi:MAG: septum formation initiator family protein [Bacteroidales bacterium]|jgi:cell division protein FtsB|nr:septum formation initiator family protein [Bacteroidales bacterium]MBR6092070.1 septum formation initiator family protein [Bacteroidales bacterium]